MQVRLSTWLQQLCKPGAWGYCQGEHPSCWLVDMTRCLTDADSNSLSFVSTAVCFAGLGSHATTAMPELTNRPVPALEPLVLEEP